MACRINRTKEGKIDKVLAPNGKPSLLYKEIVEALPSFREQAINDPFIRRALSDGRIKDTSDAELALGLYAKFDTKEFRQWFGESRTVDNNEEPKLLFHGGLEKFESFKEDAPIFFTDDLSYAQRHAVRRAEHKLGLEKLMEEAEFPFSKNNTTPTLYPVVVKAETLVESEFWMNSDDAGMQLDKTQADAIQGKEEKYTDTYSIAVRNASQVKSIFNLGSFDDSNNIYFHLGEVGHNSDLDIAQAFLPVLANYGISVESIEDYSKRHGITLPEAATALADPFRKVIAIANGKMSPEVLGEEFGHIVIDNTPSGYELTRALSYVEKTAEYKEARTKYKEAYKGDDAKIKKEVLGQLLGKHIIKQLERKGDNGLIRILSRIWNKFLNLFKGKAARELENYLDKVSKHALGKTNEIKLSGNLMEASPTIEISVGGNVVGRVALRNTGTKLRIVSVDIADKATAIQVIKDLGEQAAALNLELTGKTEHWAILESQGNAVKTSTGWEYKPVGIYYNLQEQEERESLLDALEDSLLRRVRSLRKRGIDTKNTIRQKRAITEEKTLAGAEAGKGIASFLALLSKDSTEAIEYIISTVKDDRTEEYLTGNLVPRAKDVDPTKLSDKQLDHLGDFVYYYEPYLIDLENYLGNKDTNIPETYRKQLLEITRQELEKFRRVKTFRNNVREVAVEDIFRQSMIAELGLDPNSSDVDEQITTKLGYDWKATLSDYKKDTPQLEYWFGSMRDATDQILRAVHALLARITQKVHNSAITFGKEVIDKATELGVAFRDAKWAYETEVGEDGKRRFTGNYISPYKLAEWRRDFQQFRTELHERFNVPEDWEERREIKDMILEKIARQEAGEALSSEDQWEINQYKDYNRATAEWFMKHTMPLENAKEVIAKRKKELTTAEYKLWYHRNVGTGFKKDGTKYTYYKGELSVPSNGIARISSYDGVSYNTKNYSNSDWAGLADNQKQFMNWLLEKKYEIEAKLPIPTQVTRAPQMTENMMDIFFQKKGDILRRLGQEVKETFQAPLEEDYITGEEVERRPDGSVVRYVPIRFVKYLEDTDRISTDLLAGILAYHEMAENYIEKAKHLPKFNLIQEQMANRRFQDKRLKKAFRGAEKTSYKYLENFLDMNISGQVKSDLEFLGINWTKALGALANYVRVLNLGWNLFTQTSNMLSSQGFGLVEAFVNEHFGPKDRAWASKEFWKNIRDLDMLNPVQRNKMALLMQYMGISGDPKHFFDNLDKSKLVRKKGFVGDPFFGYEFGDFIAKAPIMLAVLHNYRLYEGKFYTRREFIARGGTDAQYDALEKQSAWNTIQVDKSGKLDLNMPEDIFNRVAGRVRYLSDQIDGKLSSLDYAAIQRHAVFSLILIHRNWLVAGIQRRFKPRGYNYMTGTTEEGHYSVAWRGAAKLVRTMVFSDSRMEDLRALLASWPTLDPVTKKAVVRVIMDMAFAAMAITVAVILNRIADGEDDDDYALNLAAYMGNRVALEAGAFFNPKELITVIEDPFVPLRLMEYSLDIMDLLDPSEIERGPWEGWTKQERFFMRLFPGVKFAQVAADPGATNQFLKNKPLKLVYDFEEILLGEE